MKKLSFVAAMLLLCTLSIASLAQSKMTRPSAVGNGAIDGYVDESFDIYDRVVAARASMNNTEQLIEKAKAAGSGKVSKADATNLIGELTNVITNITNLQKSVKTLAGKSADMTTSAKAMGPMKAVKALKNVDQANKANEFSVKETEGILTVANERIKWLKENQQ